jgi:hypothetical protein
MITFPALSSTSPSQPGFHVLRGLASDCDLAGLASVFRNGRQMVLVQGAQVLDVLSKGECVVAAGGDLVAKLDPLAGHPGHHRQHQQLANPLYKRVCILRVSLLGGKRGTK